MLQAATKVSDNKVDGPDAVVSEMIKHLPLEKIFIITRCFQERFLGQGIRSCRAIALTSVMSKWYASCVMMRMKKENELETWRRLNKISCQHLQVLVTNFFYKKWRMTRGEISHAETWQRCAPNNVYGKLGHQGSFRWGEAETYCKNYGESWHTRTADRSPSTWNVKTWRGTDVRMCWKLFQFQSMSASKKRRSIPAVANDDCATICFRGGKVETEKHVSPVGPQMREGASDTQLYVGRQLRDYVPLQKKWCYATWLKKRSSGDLTPLSCKSMVEKHVWGRIKIYLLPPMDWGTNSLEEKFKILGCAMNRQGNTLDATVGQNAVCQQSLLEGHFGLQEQRYVVEDQVYKIGGACVFRLLFREWKVVLDHSDNGQNQEVGQKAHDAPVPLQYRDGWNMGSSTVQDAAKRPERFGYR